MAKLLLSSASKLCLCCLPEREVLHQFHINTTTIFESFCFLQLYFPYRSGTGPLLSCIEMHDNTCWSPEVYPIQTSNTLTTLFSSNFIRIRLQSKPSKFIQVLNPPPEHDKSHFGFVNQAHSACQHAGMHREFCTATVSIRSSSMQTRTPS